MNEEKERDAYFLFMQSDKKFQKYIVQELIAPKLKRLTNYKHLYEDSSFDNSTDAEISKVHKQNKNTYLVLKTMFAPVLTEDDRENL